MVKCHFSRSCFSGLAFIWSLVFLHQRPSSWSLRLTLHSAAVLGDFLYHTHLSVSSPTAIKQALGSLAPLTPWWEGVHGWGGKWLRDSATVFMQSLLFGSSKLELALSVKQLKCLVQNHQDSKVFCDHWGMAPAMRPLENGAGYVTTGEWRWLCDLTGEWSRLCDHWEMAPAMWPLGNGTSYVTTG